jgi:hypothetical protein
VASPHDGKRDNRGHNGSVIIEGEVAALRPRRIERLLLFNLATDDQDPLLAFTVDWVRALAERVPYVEVVTMRSGTAY